MLKRRLLWFIMCCALIVPLVSPAWADGTDYIAKIDDTKYASLSEALTAATEGQTVKIISADTYELPNIPENITIEGDTDGVIFSHTGSEQISLISNGVTFRKLTFNFGTNNYHGFQHQGGTASF
ncbi:MAG: hypothetical protein IJP88_00960, partial [Synergistaceae bacterium]|nr:hypothetical protein [Synergistaceae bacterium]